MTKAQRIIDDLEKKDITIYKISKETLITSATLGNWKNGNVSPSPALLMILEGYAKHMEVNYEK